MPLKVSYMGTKRQLAGAVADVISEAPDGPVLDLFSGMCAVGEAVAPARPVWCNDVQLFSAEVAKAFFRSHEPTITSFDAASLASEHFERNKILLANRLAKQLDREEIALTAFDALKLAKHDASLPNYARSRSLEAERADLAKRPSKLPYRLFSLTFSGGYFGLLQCIEIDSIRYAIDRLSRQDEIREEQRRWALLALCQAACRVSNTTGHFAQYLKVSDHNVDRCIRQRRRSVWTEWLRAIDENSPVGPRSWRSRNRVFRNDAITILKNLRGRKKRPSVVYADPPYTKDQYSRYYHLYETLLLYDYPRSIGIGRYRPDRFVSHFCMQRRIRSEMERLIAGCAELGSELVLSYPDNGLLAGAREFIFSAFKQHSLKCEIAHDIEHHHSSLGASKGVERHLVREVIYRGH